MLFLNKKYFFTKICIDNTGIATKFNKKELIMISWEEVSDIDIKFNSCAKCLVINKQSEKSLIFGITAKRLQEIKSYCNNIIILQMLDKIKISIFKYHNYIIMLNHQIK